MGCHTREGGECDPSTLVVEVNCDVDTVFNYSAETDHDVHSALQRQEPTPKSSLQLLLSGTVSPEGQKLQCLEHGSPLVPWANLPPHLG